MKRRMRNASQLTVIEYVKAPKPADYAIAFDSLIQWTEINPSDFIGSPNIEILEKFLLRLPQESMKGRLFRAITKLTVDSLGFITIDLKMILSHLYLL
jgi:hypothetical protein